MVGVLIVEDLIAILLMATLTAIASGAGLSAGSLLLTVGRLFAFLLGLVVVGLLVVPRAVRLIVRLKRDETTLVASIGICFAIALLAHAFGYPVALGAFLAGSLVAESGEAHEVERLVLPVRDAHVRAGAQVVVEALGRQSATSSDDRHALDDVNKLLPGLGEPEAIRLPADAAAVGRSLAELDLRGVTGATVLAISRDGHGLAIPAATEVLRAGDVLAVAGTHDSVAAARVILCRRR